RKVMSPYIVQKLVESPLLAPYIIGAYSILVVFMQNGVLSMILQKIGIIESYRYFPILTNDKDGYGIIITYLWKTVPFIVMMSMPVVKRVSDRWDNLAKVYGLSDFGFYKKITLPLLAPTLVVSFFIILSYFFISFETPYLLGVTHPKSLAVYIYDIYSRGELEERGYVMAMNIVVSIISLLTGGVISLFLKFFSRFDDKGWG
ncbi:MAG: ABC transporter permease subunit, partial [Fusobacteriaceae bacterium]